MRKGEFSIPIKLVILVTVLFIVATLIIVSILEPNLLNFSDAAGTTISDSFDKIGGFIG